METVLEFMGNDHDRLDAIFQQYRKEKKNDMGKALGFFHHFKVGLQKHIVWEEEILFPLFEEKTGTKSHGPTFVMREEHRQIKGFLEKIHDAFKENKSPQDSLDEGLLEVLGAHNEKEESILYPWIDNEASEQDREAAFQQMESLPPEKYNLCCG